MIGLGRSVSVIRSGAGRGPALTEEVNGAAVKYPSVRRQHHCPSHHRTRLRIS